MDDDAIVSDLLRANEEFAKMTPEEIKRDMEEWLARQPAKRAAHMNRKPEEVDKAFRARMEEWSETVGNLIGQLECPFHYLIKKRIEDFDYDWRERDIETKLKLFDRAVDDVTNDPCGKLADYFEESIREQFIRDHENEEHD